MHLFTPAIRILVTIIIVTDYLIELIDYYSDEAIRFTFIALLLIGFFKLSYVVYSSVQAYREIITEAPLAANALRVYAILFGLINTILPIVVIYILLTATAQVDLFNYDVSKSLIVAICFSYLTYIDIGLLRAKSNI